MLPTYLSDGSDISDNSDSSESSDSSDSSKNSDNSDSIDHKTWLVTKLKNSNYEEKRRKIYNLKCDKTQKLKLWPNSETQIVTNIKYPLNKTQILTKPKNSKGFITPRGDGLFFLVKTMLTKWFFIFS